MVSAFVLSTFRHEYINEASFIFRLISASIGTVVYYGYKCHPEIGYYFLVLSFGTGLAGSIFPFMSWFNQVEHRVRYW